MKSRPLEVLVVCEGNIGRSPAAQLLLAHTVDPRIARFTSAGVGATAGLPICAEVRGPLVAAGIDPDAHRSQKLSTQLVGESDLILGATRRHASKVVELDVRALRRTYTLVGFARQVEDLSEASGLAAAAESGPDAWLTYVIAQRGRRTRVHEAEDDIPDPYRAPGAAVRKSMEMTARACQVIASALGQLTPATAAPASRR